METERKGRTSSQMVAKMDERGNNVRDNGYIVHGVIMSALFDILIDATRPPGAEYMEDWEDTEEEEQALQDEWEVERRLEDRAFGKR